MDMNIEKIKDKYNKLKEENSDILSLEKVISLEEGKENFILNYLSKIVKVDEHSIYFKNEKSILMDSFIKKAEAIFGELTFLENRETADGWIIEIAFSFSLVSIHYYYDKKNIKYKINVFWDR